MDASLSDSSVVWCHLACQVIFLYNAIDDFVMTNLQSFNKRQLVSAEAKDLNLGKSADAAEEEEDPEDPLGLNTNKLSKDDAEQLGAWLKEIMPTKIETVVTTVRVKD